MPIKKYNHLIECEIEAALTEIKQDMKKNKYISESVE